MELLAEKLAVALAKELAEKIISKEGVVDPNSLYVLFEVILEFPELKNDKNVAVCMSAMKERLSDA
jgi:hypothetical protein